MPADESPPSGDPWAPLVEAAVGALRDSLARRSVHVDTNALRYQLVWGTGEQADLSWPLHRAAKELHVPPEELAGEIAREFPSLPGLGGVRAVAGYLNLDADPAWIAKRTLELVFAQGERYGSGPVVPVGACVEHTSANPTGPFHIGRVRNGIIGDTIARVLRASGTPVTTQYYVDDVGRQAAMITWIWSQPIDRWPEEIRAAAGPVAYPPSPSEKPDLALGRPYPAVSAYLKTHEEAREEVAELSRRFERGEAPELHHELAERILAGMVASLGRIGITFDEFVWESTFLHDHSVDGVIARVRQAPHAVTEPNGALAIDTTSYGLPKEDARVIVTRGDGTSLYPTRDIAYHLSKFARFPRVIDVLGQDHQLHARTLEALLAEVGESRRPEFVIYQDITVPDGGRMSTRKGSAVYLDDLLDEATDRAVDEIRRRREDLGTDEVMSIASKVASGAVRYHILRVAPEKAVRFRWEDALSFEGRSGPFLQYSYARASSLLRKAGATEGPWSYDPTLLATPEERAVVRSIARLPSTIAYVARSAHVHTLAGYAHELAEAFNRFYEAAPVLTATTQRASRLALVAATRQTLGIALDLLGVDRLERM